MDRCASASGLGNVHPFNNIIRGGIGAPAEAASRKERVNLDLSGIQTGGLGGVGLIRSLKLIARPNLATAV